jgi:glutamate/tyrosine decarboxylase-like PLP-dependent enzyme
MHLHQHIHAQLQRQGIEIRQLLILQCRHYQQDAVRAYAEAIGVTLDLAAAAASRIEAAGHLRLVWEPQLSVVVFERVGWSADDYQAWTEQALRDGTAFVVPSRHDGRPVLRFCFVNPRTTVEDIDVIIDALR